ncbi:MAG: polysaccharide biosynthesis PFTS motif protein [Desulfobacula sp.]
MKNQAAYINNRFDSIIKSVEKNKYLSNLSNCFGYSQENIKNRIVQRVVEICFPAFTKRCRILENSGLKIFPEDGELLNLSGILIDPQNGNIKLTTICMLKLLVDCILRFMHFVIYIYYYGKKRGINSLHLESATLLLGVGDGSIFVDQDDSRFVDFCRKGPIVPLSSATNLIVQSFLKDSMSSGEHIFYSRYPFHTLVSFSKISFAGRIHLSMMSLIGLLKFFYFVIKSPALMLLANDIPYVFAAKVLDKKKIIENIIITNSYFGSQPLWMQELCNCSLHMVWYSQNTREFVYKSDNIVSEHPAYRHLNIDESWVWTHQFAKSLIQNSKKHKTHCVYPVLWYRPKDNLKANNMSKLKIGVFDITPITKQANFQLGLSGHFCNAETMTSFIRDIVELKKAIELKMSLKVEVSVKVKRNYNPGHDQSYIKQLQRLEESGVITLPQNNIDLFSFISNCSFVVVIPNSSPALVAEYIGIPSIYYDPTKILQPNNETGKNIWFASGYDELLDTSFRVLGKAADLKKEERYF